MLPFVIYFLIKSIKIDRENDLFRYKTLTKAKLSVYHLSLVIRLAREMTLADNLVIVESPAKAKTIEKYLGKKYKVIASMGHVRDLPRSQMGVDTEDNYEPKYITIRGKGPVVKELKNMQKSENVFLASDPDREGEAIAWHLSKF